jgi:hypothetical protein
VLLGAWHASSRARKCVERVGDRSFTALAHLRGDRCELAAPRQRRRRAIGIDLDLGHAYQAVALGPAILLATRAHEGALEPGEPLGLVARVEREDRTPEWLNAQAAGGYVTYEPETGKYALPPEQAFALADDASPAAVAGAFMVVQAIWNAVQKTTENFRTGAGLEWGHQHPCLSEGTERFFRAGYIGNLLSA